MTPHPYAHKCCHYYHVKTEGLELCKQAQVHQVTSSVVAVLDSDSGLHFFSSFSPIKEVATSFDSEERTPKVLAALATEAKVETVVRKICDRRQSAINEDEDSGERRFDNSNLRRDKHIQAKISVSNGICAF
nr:hypothetical protein Iba_chr01aCG16860 [Ipomoea batatas]